MISRKEIQQKAEDKGVPPSIIEKDWILGHFLDAIYSIEVLKENLVFKGGTCLKKCYFNDYRFSEDLDFTSKAPNLKVTQDHIKEVARIVEENSGAKTSFQSFKPLHYNDKLTGFEGKIKYYGPDHNQNVTPPPLERWTTNIKIEITLYEILLFPGVDRTVNHPYSDKLTSDSLKVPAYGKFEIMTEKIRSLIQRPYSAPRDYYDIWFILQETTFYKDILKRKVLEKMAYKGLELNDVNQFFEIKDRK